MALGGMGRPLSAATFCVHVSVCVCWGQGGNPILSGVQRPSCTYTLSRRQRGLSVKSKMATLLSVLLSLFSSSSPFGGGFGSLAIVGCLFNAVVSRFPRLQPSTVLQKTENGFVIKIQGPTAHNAAETSTMCPHCEGVYRKLMENSHLFLFKFCCKT